MRFMVIMKATADSEAGIMPSEQLLTEMTAFNQELTDAGILLAGEGLHPSSKGARVTYSDGKVSVTDGPFAETKELIAGFWLIDVSSMDEAIEWVKRVPNPDNEDGVIEIRQVFDAEDFGEEFTPDARAAEERMRTQIAVESVNPYLNFSGDCRAAFEFYADCLGGEIESIFTHGGTPAEEHVPVEWREKIMHASLKVGHTRIMGSDVPPDRFEKPVGFAVQLSISKPDDAERIFHKLADGGTETMPIQKTFWATRFGMLVDRFGIPWMINCE